MIEAKQYFVKDLIIQYGIIYRCHFNAKNEEQAKEVFDYLDAQHARFFVGREGFENTSVFRAFMFRQIVYVVSKADLLQIKLALHQYLHFTLESVTYEANDDISWTWQHLREKLNER